MVWYGEYRPILGAEFLFCVEEALDRIARHPLTYSRIVGEYQKALVHHFPFGVIDRMAGADAVVVAVQHTSRHPDAWQGRSQ